MEGRKHTKKTQNMYQDGPRSVVYRSFFSCDDPKGVVECKTNRKSKTDSLKLEDKVKHQKKQKNLSTSFSSKEERKVDRVSNGVTDHDLHNNPSSYQLMEISREAQKLHKVVDSGPKEKTLDRHTKDIAEDLLRGALNLKESLTMLGKLQEASQIMAKLKKKQKEKSPDEKLEGFGIGRTMSERFGHHDRKVIEYQNPRLSVDGSTRDCFEELREVIRESFARQNLLPKGSHEEKAFSATKTSNEDYSAEKPYFDRTKSDFSLDIPSTSSSQTSMFHSHEFDTSSDFSISKSIEEKPKAPNVIAKLMGLEAVPTKPSPSNPLKYYGQDKALNQETVPFDIDLSMARRSNFTVQKVDPQLMPPNKVTDDIQFKGIVAGKSVVRPDHLSNASEWKKRFAYDAAPIVIIKPLHGSGFLEEEFLKQKYIRQELEAKKMLRKWKIKVGLPPRPNNSDEGALNFTEIHRKPQAEKAPAKIPRQAKGEKECVGSFSRKDDKSVKRQDNDVSSTTVNASAPVKSKIQKKDVNENKVPKNQRAPVNTRKQMEVDTEKSRDTSKSSHINKHASTNPRKSETEPNVSKVRVPTQKGSKSESIPQSITSATSQNSSVRRKNVKNEKRSSVPSTIVVERKYKNDDIPIGLEFSNDEALSAKGITPLVQLPGDAKDTLRNLDNCSNSNSSPCESTYSAPPNDKIRSVDDAKSGINHDVAEVKSCKRDKNTRKLLLDSSSFLYHVEELFDAHACQPVVSHKSGFCSGETADTKLLLECAKELLEQKSLQCRVALHPLLHVYFKKSKVCISLDRLVDEVCDGIEYLRGYCELAGKAILVDTLSAVLQKDMSCKGAVNGTWDFGWRNGFTRSEIDQVVIDIEEKILTGIVDDLLMDMAI